MTPIGPAGAAVVPDKKGADAVAAARHCPPTVSNYQADKIGDYRGQRLTPKKLNELPPATSYMAVLREIGGCNAPMTMVEYRNSARR